MRRITITLLAAVVLLASCFELLCAERVVHYRKGIWLFTREPNQSLNLVSADQFGSNEQLFYAGCRLGLCFVNGGSADADCPGFNLKPGNLRTLMRLAMRSQVYGGRFGVLGHLPNIGFKKIQIQYQCGSGKVVLRYLFQSLS